MLLLLWRRRVPCLGAGLGHPFAPGPPSASDRRNFGRRFDARQQQHRLQDAKRRLLKGNCGDLLVGVVEGPGRPRTCCSHLQEGGGGVEGPGRTPPGAATYKRGGVIPQLSPSAGINPALNTLLPTLPALSPRTCAARGSISVGALMRILRWENRDLTLFSWKGGEVRATVSTCTNDGAS